MSVFGVLLFLFIWREITRCCRPTKTVIVNERRTHLIEMAPVAMAAMATIPVVSPVNDVSKKTPEV